jgi:multidrug efflux pump subunit AcrA (membrane-fusion protein)
VRLVAINAKGTVDGSVETFVTLSAVKPTIATGSATSVLTTTATLTGTVDPNGSDTTYRFEYGTSTGYGSQTAKLDAGSGTAAVQVTASIGGLKAGTAYLVRLVATNSSGTSAGIPQVLDTAASSCVGDRATITADEQAIQKDESTVATDETSLTQTTATIAESESPSATTIAQDQAAVNQAQATVDADQKAVDETTLRASASGTVTAVNGSVGDVVGSSSSSSAQGATTTGGSATGQGAGGAGAATTSTSSSSSSSSALITIDSLDKLQVISGFAEADATKLAVGDPATVTLSALPNVEVAGKVVAVSTTSTVVNNVVTYDTTISLVNPPADVKEGMTANVSVVVQSRSNVLELPSAAITTTGQASTVELLENGETTTTPVQVGLVGSSSTQVVSGLRNGAVVVVPTVSVAGATSSTGTGTGLGAGAGGLGGGGFGGGAGGGAGGLGRAGG